jgi:hypothetical protein
MKTSEKNLITEINRIHQLMGVKKLITESKKLLGSLLGMAQEFVEYASKIQIKDVATRRAISELETAVNTVRTSGGKVNLTPEEYIKIFNNLRKSANPGIIAKMAELDRRIVTSLRDNLSEVTDTPEVSDLIKQIIDDGGTLDDVNDVLAQLFKKRYGNYVNFATVVDDAGNVIKELMDEYLERIRKVYENLGGKVVVDDDGGETIVEEILDLSPLFIRYQTEHLRAGEILANEVMGLIERRATIPETSGTEILNLNQQIKNSMDRLRKWNIEYVQRLEAEVENRLTFTDSPDHTRWVRINDVLKEIKIKKGNWGVQKGTTPLTAIWKFIWKSFQAGTKFEIQLAKNVDSLKYIWPGNWGKAAKKLGEAFSEGQSGANKLESEIQAFREEVDTDLLAKTSFFEEYFIPGSPRGIPWPRKNPSGNVPNADELYLPNAYGQIQALAKRYPMLQSWASLLLEKIWVVIKIQLHYTWIMGSYDLLKFILTDEKNIQKKYGDCVDEMAKALKNGTFKIVDDIPQGVPPCLLELMKSEQFLEEELGEFMIRADFFSRGEGREAYLGYYTPYLKEIGMMDLSRLFTGSLLGLVNKFFTEWLDKQYDAEKAGDTVPFGKELDAFGKSLQNDLKKIEEKENTLVNNLSKSDKDKVVEFIDSVQNASGGTDFVINTDN